MPARPLRQPPFRHPSAASARRRVGARTGTRRRLALAALLLGAAAPPLPAQVAPPAAPAPIRFARYAHVANDGRIAFTYQDDIWLADRDGSNAQRLTAHVARDFMPRFSPDGRWIAFTSNRMGNNDVYVMPVTGGEPQRLTWHSGDDQALYFTPDGREVVFTSGRGVGMWGSPLYRVALDGSLPRPLPMDAGRSGMISQDMTMVAFNRSVPSYWRKGYRGNNNADIAVQDLRTGQVTELTDTDLQQFRTHTHDVHPMWGRDGRIYFASERDGIFNIWRIAATGGAPEQVTRHRDDGVQFPAISPDGSTLVYENGFELWTLDVPSGTPRKVAIRMASDPKENDIGVIAANGRADGFTVSPAGDYVAVDVHGDIVVVPAERGVGEMTRVTESPWRDRSQVWSPDGSRIAFISDESGEEEIWLWQRDTRERRKLTTHQSIKGDLTWSGDGRRLAFTADNRLWEVDVTSGAPRELAHNPAGGFSIAQYSPSGRELLYTRRDDDQNAEVYLFDIASRREHNLSDNPFGDGNPVLTPDGRHVVFTSSRDEGTNHLFIVSLARRTEDPDDPLVRERLRRANGRDERADSTAGAAGAETPAGGANRAAGASAASLTVDTTGIGRRAIQLTRGAGSVGSVFLSRDGRSIHFTVSGGTGEEGNGLFSIGLDGQNRRRIAAGSFPGLTPTADRRMVFFRRAAGGGGEAGGPPTTTGSEVHRLTLASPQRTERVDFDFTVQVDRRAEWRQLLAESWRVMKYRFYDEQMHGRDWDAIWRTYEPLLAHVGTNEDLYDLANEMIGELNASHTGVSGPPSRPMPRLTQTRLLGLELEPDAASRRYRIAHIHAGGPADREWLGLAVGDYVLAIDGQELAAGDNYWKTLSNTLNSYVPVRVSKQASGADARTVRIATVTSLGDIKYDEWVAERRAIVDRETDGQIAYVHIRSMNQPSLARFRNEINQFSNKAGIIVDIRYNGGGNIDQELIDILERQPYQFWNNRSGSRAWGRRPRQAIAGPKVMLINQRSGSDSEVTPMAFRQLGLGRIVGNPTAAAVIATGSYTLINGGSIRTPGSLVVTYDPTKPDNYGVNLENLGVPPDVWVRNSPMDELAKRDRELEAAIAEAMRMLRAARAASEQEAGAR
jgi:tricorn protease